MSQFITSNNHPLIPRGKTYVLDRKLISFHSYDRDIKKWPLSNYFEIDLPQSLTNIQSIRLVNISLPSNQYVFSNEYQNTKFNFTTDVSGQQKSFDVEISEGYYTPDQLVNEIQNKMNRAVVNANFDGTWDPTFTPANAITTYDDFKCTYNDVDNTFWFGNDGKWSKQVANSGRFYLNFHKKMSYTISTGQVEVWKNYSKWGLPSYLGYQKKRYISIYTPSNEFFSGTTDTSGAPFGFSYEITDPNLETGGYWLQEPSNNRFIDMRDDSTFCNLDTLGDDFIYMEVDKFNSMDEIEPYSENTSGWFNNDYGGKINSAFAKIPIQYTQFSQAYNTNRSFLSNISHYNPPIKRIDRLKFKFRYHDGRLVDFKCLPLTFVIEFNTLVDEPGKKMNIRIPPLYKL